MPRTSRIVDASGQPIVLADLQREIATPGLTGVRSPLSADPSAGLTPERLAYLLRASESGNAVPYLELAEIMEEKHLHYRSVLGTRRQACAGLPVTVEAASDDAADVRAAALVEEAVRADGFEDALLDLLDGLGKGFAVCEILWETSERDWRPRDLVWRDPRWFQFERENGQVLRLRDGSTDGLPLAPYKFVRHLPRTKAGLPIRGGLARCAAWAYLFANFSLRDWVVFCEAFGMPLRLGKFPAGTSPEDVDVLKQAVWGIGSDWAAVVPDGMVIEFIERKISTSGTTIYEGLLRYLDEQVSKGVLGQTMTADNGSSRAQASVHNEVRHDLLRLDARQLGGSLNRDFVRPLIDLNLGPQARYPRIVLQVEEPEDVQALAVVLEKLVPLGLEVEQSVVLDKIGLPAPAKGAKLLGAPATVTPPAPGNAPLPAAQARSAQAQAGADPAPDQTALDAAATAQRARLQPLAEALLAPVLAAIEQADDYETALHALGEALPALPVDGLAELLARSGFAAQLHGRLSAQVEGQADA